MPREQNQLGKWIADLQSCLREQFDDEFNQQTRHPGTLVLLLRDLIDLRLLLRHFYAGQIDYLNDCIVNLAPIVRHLRHGDGGLSSFTGNATQRLEAFCDSVLGDGLVDMALSLADSRAILTEPAAMGYVRCSTKPGFFLVNTEASTVYTTLHDWHMKSTGVLDFEWSERAQRLLTRCDVSIYTHDSKQFMRYKQLKKPLIKNKIIHEKGHAFFSSDYQINYHPTKADPYGAVLQAKRDLYISPHGDIRGEDILILSQLGQGCVRFLAAPELEWRITNETESALLCRKATGEKVQKSEHLKKFLCQGAIQLHTIDVMGHHALCLVFPLDANVQTSVKWALSPAS